MSAVGAGLGPFDQLASETAQHEHAVAPDFPFVMVTVPAFWVVEDARGWKFGALIEGGAKNPTSELAFAEHTPDARTRARRALSGWHIRPATAEEIAEWQARA